MNPVLYSLNKDFILNTSNTHPAQEAIEDLPNNGARDMCLRFAETERLLGEIDRAREIYVYGSQISDPRCVYLLFYILIFFYFIIHFITLIRFFFF